MNKKNVIGLLLIVAAIVAWLFIWHKSSKHDSLSIQSPNKNDTLRFNRENKTSNNNNQESINRDMGTTDSIPDQWKTYSNNKLGINFRYPDSWIKQDKDAEIINLSGSLIKTGVYFSDTTNQTRVSIQYTMDSTAAKIYEYAASQFISSKKSSLSNSRKFFIDGSEAVEISKEYKVNGKGKKLNPPLRILIVDFMDKNNKGEFQIQFQTPITREPETENSFKQFLSSFKFIKN